MNIAEASLEETRYLMILANDLGYWNSTRLLNDLEETSKMLTGLMRKIGTK